MMSKSKNIGYLMARNIEAAANRGRGTSKRAARANGSGTKDKVYSDVTRANYIKACKTYAKWVQENHPEAYRDMAAAEGHVAEYLQGIGNSGSRMAAAAALAKAYGRNGGASWGVALGSRPLAQITRGRTPTARATAWAANHAEVAEACRCLGPRAGKEATAIRGADVHVHADGSVTVHIVGKGGLVREAPVWSAPGNTAGKDWICARAREVGPGGHIFGGVPGMSHANLHSMRADYAARMYAQYAASDKATGQMYRPQDGSGSAWDKGALDATSAALGHGDRRFATVYYNYLSYGKAD